MDGVKENACRCGHSRSLFRSSQPFKYARYIQSGLFPWEE